MEVEPDRYIFRSSGTAALAVVVCGFAAPILAAVLYAVIFGVLVSKLIAGAIGVLVVIWIRNRWVGTVISVDGVRCGEIHRRLVAMEDAGEFIEAPGGEARTAIWLTRASGRRVAIASGGNRDRRVEEVQLLNAALAKCRSRRMDSSPDPTQHPAPPP